MSNPTTPEELVNEVLELYRTPHVGVTWRAKAATLIAETFERWRMTDPRYNHLATACRRLAKWRDMTIKQRDFYYEAGRGETRRAEAAELRVRELESFIAERAAFYSFADDTNIDELESMGAVPSWLRKARALLKEVRE